MLRDAYAQIYKSKEWKIGSYYLLAMRIYLLSFTNNGKFTGYPYLESGMVLCEECDNTIEQNDGYYLCEIHHTEYNKGILNPKIVNILHPECHKKVHKKQ